MRLQTLILFTAALSFAQDLTNPPGPAAPGTQAYLAPGANFPPLGITGVAVINSLGRIDAIQGASNPLDCVLANGTFSPCSNSASIGGVVISGTPGIGYLPTATGPTTATWQPAPTGGGGSGTLSTYLNSTLIGTRGAYNFLAGNGSLLALTDTGSAINIQISADPSYMATNANVQSGILTAAAAASASGTTYVACPSQVVAALTKYMVIQFVPDVNSSGGATTLNLCTLGATPLKLANGTSNPSSSSLVGGWMYTVWYDGTNFRLKDVSS